MLLALEGGLEGEERGGLYDMHGWGLALLCERRALRADGDGYDMVCAIDLLTCSCCYGMR